MKNLIKIIIKIKSNVWEFEMNFIEFYKIDRKQGCA
jgi:hypothetical protein